MNSNPNHNLLIKQNTYKNYKKNKKNKLRRNKKKQEKINCSSASYSFINRSTSLGNLDKIPKYVLQDVFFYLDFRDIGKVRKLNSLFYKLTTGYDKPGLVGVTNKPSRSFFNLPQIAITRELNFSNKKFTPETISSLLFYKLSEKVKNLRHTFWPYLQSTNINTLHLQIQFKQNEFTTELAEKLAKELPNSKIHTLYLCNNEIPDTELQDLHEVLPHTQLCSIHLVDNYRDSGHDSMDRIDNTTKAILRKNYPHIKWIFE